MAIEKSISGFIAPSVMLSVTELQADLLAYRLTYFGILPPLRVVSTRANRTSSVSKEVPQINLERLCKFNIQLGGDFLWPSPADNRT